MRRSSALSVFVGLGCIPLVIAFAVVWTDTPSHTSPRRAPAVVHSTRVQKKACKTKRQPVPAVRESPPAPAETATISGIVLTPRGKPAVGALVFPWPMSKSPARTKPSSVTAPSSDLRTNAQGRFSLRDLPLGTYKLTVVAPGYPTQSIEGVKSGNSAVGIRLHGADSILGRVVDASGRAIGPPQVTAFPPEPVDLRVGTTVEGYTVEYPQEIGSFVVVGLGHGVCNLVIQVRGYVPARLDHVKPGTGELVVKLKKGRPISGTVVDSSGSPLPGALVSLSPAVSTVVEGGWGPNLFTICDGEGRFVAGVGRNIPFELDVRADGYVPKTIETVLPGQRNLVIHLRAGVRLAGTVVDESSRPVANARVRCMPDADVKHKGRPTNLEEIGAPAIARTDSRGRFSFSDLEPGLHLITVNSNTYQEAYVRGIKSGTMDIRVHLRKGGVISGVVVDDEGKPVDAATVIPRPSRQIHSSMNPNGQSSGWKPTKNGFVSTYSSSRRCTSTDGAGRFTIAWLAPGDYALEIDAGGYENADVPKVHTGTKRLRVQLVRGFALSGTVVDIHGKPIKWVWVTAFSSTTFRSQNNFSRSMVEKSADVTDQSGRFQVAGLKKGTYQIRFEAKGYVTKNIDAGVSGNQAHLEIILGKEKSHTSANAPTEPSKSKGK